MRRFSPSVIVMLLILPHSAPAQQGRYEMGQRLRAFETEWTRVTDAASRKRALPHLEEATKAFFTSFVGGREEEVGRHLDLARLALGSEKEPEPDVLWASSCVLKPARRLVPAGDDLSFALERYYRPRIDMPKDLRLRVEVQGRGMACDIDRLPLREKIAIRELPEGDYTLSAEIRRGETILASSRQTISVVDRPKERLEKIEKELARFADQKSTDSLTAASLTALLKRLADGQTLETTYPAARLMKEVEDVLASLKEGKPCYGKDRAGQFWLDLAPGRRPVRVQVPVTAKEGKPLPLVIALHGAGGSENLFFDGYGSGAIAKMCAERGWLLAATRGGLSDGVLDELCRLYPVDKKRIFLVGHSMGAAQAVAAADRDPEKYAGVAALGGGGAVRASEEVKKVAFFVGIGKEDFALEGAQSLRNSLERAKVEKLVYKEYDDIEHLVIVQLCLPEVFKLFDEIAKK